LAKRGQYEKHIFFITAGLVHNKLKKRYFSPGNIVNMVNIYHKEPSESSLVVFSHQVTALSFTKAQFYEILDQFPEFKQQIYEVVDKGNE
jgi:CRP-like cAMP-binding protein